MALPAASVAVAMWLWSSLRDGIADWKPFAGAVTIFLLAFLGLAYSIFPFVVVERMTIWEAAAHPSALQFMFWGAIFVLPFIVGYTFFAYRVFRGKVQGPLYK